jgi:hypothetical protein
MAEGKDEKGTYIVVGVLGAAAAAVAQTAGVDVGLGVAAATGLSVFAGSIPAIIRHGFTRRDERRCQLAQLGIAKAAADSAVDPAQLQDSEATQETFVSMFHDLMDAVDDAVAPSLGHIAMSYAQENKRPDRVFRAFGRVVRELDADELRSLRAVFEKVASSPSPSEDTVPVRTAPVDPEGVTLQVKQGGADEWKELLSLRRGVRLLLLLKQYGLAHEATNDPGTWGNNPVTALVPKRNAARALRHIILD